MSKTNQYLLDSISKSISISSRLIKENVPLGPLPKNKEWAAKYNPTFREVQENDDEYYINKYNAPPIEDGKNPPPVYRGKEDGIWMERSVYNQLMGLKDDIDDSEKPDITSVNIPVYMVYQKVTRESPVVMYTGVSGADRLITLININGIKVPFYTSTGTGGKIETKKNHWYPFFGIGEDGWLNKTHGEDMANYYGSPVLRYVSQELDKKYKELVDHKDDDDFWQKFKIPSFTQPFDIKNQGYAWQETFDFINQDMNPKSNDRTSDVWNDNIKPIIRKINKITPYISQDGINFPKNNKYIINTIDALLSKPKNIEKLKTYPDDDKRIESLVSKIQSMSFSADGEEGVEDKEFYIDMQRLFRKMDFNDYNEALSYIRDVSKTILKEKGLLSSGTKNIHNDLFTMLKRINS